MTVQVTSKEFSSSSDESISSVNQMEVGLTLDNDLATNASGVTFLDSAYACYDKGDVFANVTYLDSGSEILRCKEFYDARSFYGVTAFTVSGAYAGSYGEPISGTASTSFVNRVNRWLEDRQHATSCNLTIKDVHFRIDATGQKRVMIIYDATTQTNTRYYAKIYSQASTQVGFGDGPMTNYDKDVQVIEHAGILIEDEQWVSADVDPSGEKHVFAIYAVDAR